MHIIQPIPLNSNKYYINNDCDVYIYRRNEISNIFPYLDEFSKKIENEYGLLYDKISMINVSNKELVLNCHKEIREKNNNLIKYYVERFNEIYFVYREDVLKYNSILKNFNSDYLLDKYKIFFKINE
jgi:hypothetical protein